VGRFVSPRARAAVATLAAALVFACAGVVTLTLQSQPAGAALSKQSPEFVLKPGSIVPKEFSKLLIGSAEVRPNPDECRNDPAMGLTCAAHRLKVSRAPGYKLTVVLEWTAVGAADTFLPDVDLYLFDDAASKFDAAEIGGGSTAMPEEASITPEQDEYDIVVQAWGGAINSYKITAYYSDKPISGGGGGPIVTPDLALSPDDAAPFRKTYTSPVAFPTTGSPALYPVVHWSPDDCRNNPAFDGICDVYRIKLNRNKTKDALNFVVIELSWQATALPDLALVAAGLGLGYFPDLDMFIWDRPDHAMAREAVGGQGDGYPERIGLRATQDEYDLVIQSGKGAVTGYTLSAFMTDEVFDKPFELLDPITGQPITKQPDGTFAPTPLPDGSGAVPGLDLAPIDVDDQIAGIGLGTTEQFDREEALRLGQQALRNVSVNSDPPSTAVLVLALAVLPLAVLAGAVALMRRRHNVLF
jgi:hypothetical protein